MATIEPFLDTNVLVYLMSAGTDKADRSHTLVRAGAVISVQVLNEFTRVGRRKFGLSFAEVRDILKTVRTTCRIVPLTLEVHEQALRLAEQYQLHIFDSNIVASAVLAGCSTLYSEDMHHGLVIDGLTITNPYRA